MIYENIGRRSILKGIGAAMGNPLGLFQKAAVATAKELAANVVVNRNITKCTVDMIPKILESYIYGVFKIPVTNGVLKHQDYDSDEIVYLDVNDIGANISKYFKNDFDKLIESTVGGEGLYGMDEAFGGVFSKLFTNAANYMGPQQLAVKIIEYCDYDVEYSLCALQEAGNFSNIMEKIFNPSDLETLRDNPNIRHLKSYFERRGVDFKTINHSPQRIDDQSEGPNYRHAMSDEEFNSYLDNDMSDDDWMATTHGGYEPGRSGGYSKDRVFESVHCYTNDYRRLLSEARL